MNKELVKEAFNYGYNSYHECNTDLDYQQHLEDCYVSILDSEYENNNGWVKILSKEDLPKEEGYYHIIDLNRAEMQLAKFYIHHNVIVDYWIKNVTHYQPIEKPLKPIY